MNQKRATKQWVSKLKNHYIFVLVFFLTLSIGRYWKIIVSGIHKTYAMPNVDTDGALYLMWYRIEQYTQGIPESINTFLNYPQGLDIIRTPYQSLLDFIFLYPFFLTGANVILLNNIVAILAYTLTGILTYIAFHYLTKSKIASFIGAILFTFSSYAIVAGRTQIPLLHTWIIPLTFLLSLRAWKTKNPWNYALLGASLAAAFHVNAYYGFFCGILFAGLSVGKILFEKKKFIFARNTGLALLVAIIGFFSINFSFFYNNLYTFDKTELQSTGKIIREPDIIETENMLIPGNDNLLYGVFDTEVSINSLFIGYLPFLLLILGIILIPRIIKKHKEWLPIITGSWITVIGTLILITFSNVNALYLKYLFMFRATSRMLRITDFIIALLVTITIATLLQKYEKINKKKLYATTVILLLWMIAEKTSLHYTVWDTTDVKDFTPALEEIKKNDSDAVLILPDSRRYKSVTYEYTLFQALFEKPIVNGLRKTEEAKEMYDNILKIDEESLEILNNYGANTILVLESLCTEKTCKTSNLKKLVEAGKLIDKGEYNGNRNQTLHRIENFKFARLYEIPKNEKTGSLIQDEIIKSYTKAVYTENNISYPNTTEKTQAYINEDIDTTGETVIVNTKKLNRYQTKFKIKTTNDQSIIGFHEPYHEDWKIYEASWLNKLCTNNTFAQKTFCAIEKTTLANFFLKEVRAEHVMLNSYANGWIIDNETLEEEYVISFQRNNIVLFTKILQIISIFAILYFYRQSKRENPKKINKKIIVYTCFVLTSLCVLFWGIEKSHTMLGSGDYLSPIAISEQFQRRLHIYEPFFIGGNDVGYLVAHLFPFYTFFVITNKLGFSPLYGTLFFISGIIFLSQASFFSYIRYVLLDKTKISKNNTVWISAIGATFYGFSPYITATISPGHTLLLLTYATFPGILKNFEQLLTKPKNPAKNYLKLFVLFALNASAYANFGLVYVSVGILSIYIILHTILYKNKITQSAKTLLKTLFILFTSNSWWMLPYLWNLRGHYNLNNTSSTTSGMNRFFLRGSTENATIGKILLGKAENLLYLDIFPNFYYIGIGAFFIFSVIAFLAIKAITNSRKNRYILLLVWLCIIGIFLTKGAQEPFHEIFFALFENIPGFQIFRRPVNKAYWFFLLTFFSLAIIGFTIITKNRKKLHLIAKILLSIGAGIYIIFFALTPHHRSFNIPQSYYEIKKQLHNENVHNVFLLPGTYGVHPQYDESINEYKGYDFVKFIWDFGVIQPDSSSYSPKTPYKPIANNLFTNIETEKSFCEQTKQLGITHIIVRKHLNKSFPQEGNISILPDKLKNSPEIKQYKEYKDIDVFTVNETCTQGMIIREDAEKKLEYNLVNPSEIQVSLENIAKEERVTLLKNFHPSWKIYLLPYDKELLITEEQNIYPKTWKNTFQSAKLLDNKPIFDENHEVGIEYANKWTISPEFIQKEYNEKYYKQNEDGSINIKIAILFSTQKLVYIGITLTIITLLTLVYKTHKKEKHEKA